MFTINAARRLIVAGQLSKQVLTAETMSQYLKRLKRLGLKSLGSGTYSEVFQHPKLNNVVVKVHQINGGFDAYTAFCQANTANPYVPKIFQVVSDPVGLERDGWGTNFTAVFMEKLRPLTTVEDKKFTAYIEGLVGINPSGKTLDYYAENSEFWKAVAKQKKDRDLAKILSWIFKTPGMHPDLYSSNVMKRGSQIILADPVVRGR